MLVHNTPEFDQYEVATHLFMVSHDPNGFFACQDRSLGTEKSSLKAGI